ncbi:helicase-related protein [Glutamicibacter bergerei]|uniref:Helicase-related protein n=1 Tax=Glutamicibacter bergerei TaxID=256702 RepID=A0ABV9MJS4_9MICC|nr:helicase [Micrococcaceae bacterium]
MSANAVELNIAPGSVVRVRDEEWLVTATEPSADGKLVRVQGLTELVRDTTATFYSALDDIDVVDPRNATVVADDSPRYRKARLFLETTLRKTPTPQFDEHLTVSTGMLANTLKYQHLAVQKALDARNVRPRILIADAVGLGKTLEIGMILSELVKRGRGDRILIVTPRHVLEQMQHEMWCRFALPFVRLDSAGIQKVRQKLPATRNPFTYYKRAIISMDTLKSARYRAHLSKLRWDAVVIDEAHNVTNVGVQNNELARLLAPNTDALILASATPHNGKNESFAELLRLLDPTVVRPDGSFEVADVERLIIRRHRHSPEVAQEVGADWAERKEPDNRLIPASAPENAVAQELSTVWLYPENGASPYSGNTSALFGWTLAKAYLSSPAALLETVNERLKKLNGALVADAREIEALTRLKALAEASNTGTSAKYSELVSCLKDIGVGKSSPMRAVVFAERVATLKSLKEKLPKALGLKPENIGMLHGGLSDVEQQEIVDQFKRGNSDLRVLVTGDVASEGVNLHSQCHHLIHFDIPWSLIRIEQRNGRIDRYGQKHSPQITTLLLDPNDSRFSGDLKVITRLMERENEAHSVLQDVASLMGRHSVTQEEDAIRDVLLGKKSFEDVVHEPDEAEGLDAWFADFDVNTEADESTQIDVPVATPLGLYKTDLDFLDEALTEAFVDPAKKIGWRVHQAHSIAELNPPQDLQHRLGHLPQDYLGERKVTETLKLATTNIAGQRELDRARESQDSMWPEAHFLGPLHPVLDWASDRALAEISRSEVLVVRGDVDAAQVLLMGTLMNQRGQVVSKAFYAVDFPNPENTNFHPVHPLADLGAHLTEIGLTSKVANPGPVGGIEALQALIPIAVDNAASAMEITFTAAASQATSRLEQWKQRADGWKKQATAIADTGNVKTQRKRVEDEQRIAESLAPAQRLIRPLLVVVPRDTPAVGSSEGTN